MYRNITFRFGAWAALPLPLLVRCYQLSHLQGVRYSSIRKEVVSIRQYKSDDIKHFPCNDLFSMVVSIPPLLGISHPNQDPHTVKREQGEYLSLLC